MTQMQKEILSQRPKFLLDDFFATMLTISLLPNQFYSMIFVAELLQYNTTV